MAYYSTYRNGTPTVVNSNINLPDSDITYVIDSSAARTLTLPAAPSNGRKITIIDGDDFLTNNTTIERNGKTIAGAAEDLVLNVQGSKVELVYFSNDWKALVY